MSYAIPTFRLGAEEYVILPRAQFERLADIGLGLDVDDPATEKRVHAGARLRAARLHAGLTQAELARRIGKSPTAVSLAEHGRMRTGAPYLAAVLEACGLPADWTPPKAKRTMKGRA
jgi:DNA-binding XRE family transcriptional regulator